MVWNRPKEVIAKPIQKSRKPLFCILGLLFALICVSVYFAAREDGTTALEESRKHSIPDKSYSQPRKPGGARGFTATNRVELTKAFTPPTIETADAFVNPKIERQVYRWKNFRAAPIFTNTFESALAGVVSALPGERFLSTELSEDFDSSFRESLKSEIVISPDDSEEVVSLKQAVIEAKNEVRKAVSEGQTASEVIIAAMEELNKIADYRDVVQEEFNKQLAKEASPDELLKFATEANKLLAEYGAMPLDAPDDFETAAEMMIDAKQDALDKLEKTEKESEHDN